MTKKVVVIGAGFAGLASACYLQKAGYEVHVVEKNEQAGGRARRYEADGFTFDMGPSWYWMPDVFETFFGHFGKQVSDYYELIRLDPSYEVFWPDEKTAIPAQLEELKKLFDSYEPGAGKQLQKFLDEAAFKYEVGINDLVRKPGSSLMEFANIKLLYGLVKMDVFQSMRQHLKSFFKHPKILELMEFPVLFLGALPQNTPALYSLMNYADIKLGTWYPKGGMYEIVKAMKQLATELGVQFSFNTEVIGFNKNQQKVTEVRIKEGENIKTDGIVAAADYHHIESLLEKGDQQYSEAYWNSRVMAPSALLYYVGLNKQLDNVAHHSLFFDTPFAPHADQIYTRPEWPDNPLFYVSRITATEGEGAPEGHDNLFFLIPVATGLTGDTEELRKKYFNEIFSRFEKRIGASKLAEHIVHYRSYSVSDFVSDYHSFKGNAYGLANVLKQTAILKPRMNHKTIKNWVYAGQLTVPGPGVPPSIISGEVAAGQLAKKIGK